MRREKDSLPLGYFGASTGAAAALIAAAQLGESIRAVVSRGGRPDLADRELPQVQSPTLLIVGSRDLPVIDMNRIRVRTNSAVKSALRLFPARSSLRRTRHARHCRDTRG